MITIIIISIGFFAPMISANGVENSRSGKGRFTPVEEIIWDWTGQSGFEDVKFQAEDENELGDSLGTGVYAEDNVILSNQRVFWLYHTEDQGTNERSIFNGITGEINDIDIEKENTIDEYGAYTFIPNAIDEGTPDYMYPHIQASGSNHFNVKESVWFYYDIDIDTMVEEDATRIDIYFEVSLADISQDIDVTVSYRNKYTEYDLGTETIVNGGIVSIDLTANDLIQIAGLEDTKDYILVQVSLTDNEDEFTDGTVMTFDLQVYGLRSRTASITVISVWFICQSLLNFFIGTIMLASVSFGGIVTWVKKAFE
ncbi:MAG: hypothetical protein ACTSQL_07370 [Promethearchaeota archaeon]